MIAAATVFASLALFLVVWSYLAYPALIARLARRATPLTPTSQGERRKRPPSSVEVLVSAADEEAVIGRRVVNLLAQEYGGRLAVAIGCDGCRDATALRAREAGDGRVRVEEFPRRRGKAAVVNDLVSSSGAEILVFTDANSEFLPRAIERLVARFSDPEVGAVCGRLVLDAPGGTPSAETEFWDRETRSKEAEGRLGVCVGANGAIYAARRDSISPLPEETALDDFLIPARIAGRGAKVVFAGDAVARESTARDVAAEASRRLRIGIGAGRVLVREQWLFDVRRRPLLALAFLSRKVARWLAPVAALLALACALFDPRLRPVAAGLALLLALLFASVNLRPRLEGWPGKLYYFSVINLALAAGVVAGLAGHRRPAWKRSER